MPVERSMLTRSSLILAFLSAGVAFLLLQACSQSAPPPRTVEEPLPNETAPDTYRVLFSTNKGDFIVLVTREWAPLGADRFYNLVKEGFYDSVRFIRVISGFMVQFGVSGSPMVSERWANANFS